MIAWPFFRCVSSSPVPRRSLPAFGFHTLKVEQVQGEMHMLALNQLKFQYLTDKMGEKTAVIFPI